MMQQPPTSPAVASASPRRPANGLPRWEQLSAQERRTLMIILSTMMVKQLAGREEQEEQDE